MREKNTVTVSPVVGRWLRERLCGNVLPNDYWFALSGRQTVRGQVDSNLGPCYKFVVRHFSADNKPQGDVGLILVSEILKDDGSIDALISEVVNSALTDANNLHSGIQLYAVYAYYTKNPNYTPRCFFRVGADEEYDAPELVKLRKYLDQLINDPNRSNVILDPGYVSEILIAASEDIATLKKQHEDVLKDAMANARDYFAVVEGHIHNLVMVMERTRRFVAHLPQDESPQLSDDEIRRALNRG